MLFLSLAQRKSAGSRLAEGEFHRMGNRSFDKSEAFHRSARISRKGDDEGSLHHRGETAGEDRVRCDLQGTPPHGLAEAGNFDPHDGPDRFGSHIPHGDSCAAGTENETATLT